MQIVDIWFRDLPQQFQGKHNIEVLIKAFSKQMQELDKVFQDLNTMTDIDDAVGQNLDYVGTIIPLTRKEAGELAGIGVNEPVISDERYRQFLRYQNLVNTNECTYYDIINGLHFLWGDIPIYYSERQGRPAMIFIEISAMSVDDEDLGLLKGLRIKPAGVGLTYVLRYNACIIEYAEHVKIINIRFVLYVSFWDSHLYRGPRRYNGMARYNARRNYGLRVGIKSLFELYMGSAADCEQIYRIFLRFCPEGSIINVCQHFGITADMLLKSKLLTYMSLTPLNGNNTGMQVITQRNVVRYNDARRYNGAMKYNALYKKEEVE